MYKPYLIPILLCSLLATQSCSKDHHKPLETDPSKPAGFLQAIEWDNGAKEHYSYNSDSTLNKIVYSFNNNSHFYEFKSTGKKIREVSDNTSLSKNVYNYDGNKVSEMINTSKNGTGTSSYKMEYTYNAAGKVEQLKHFLVNGATTTLKASTLYHYNAAGELARSVTAMDNFIITQTIDGYSSDVSFNPWAFIDFTLLENYMIFNYPVLSSMKGFPKKITRSVQLGNDPAFIDFITTNTCEISNNRINKLKVERKHPTMPSSDKTNTASLIYH